MLKIKKGGQDVELYFPHSASIKRLSTLPSIIIFNSFHIDYVDFWDRFCYARLQSGPLQQTHYQLYCNVTELFLNLETLTAFT